LCLKKRVSSVGGFNHGSLPMFLRIINRNIGMQVMKS
jgi:hypothetical protein